MEILNKLSTTLLVLAVAVPVIYSEEIATRNEESLKPPLVVNPIDHLTLDQENGPKPGYSLAREKRQSSKGPENRKTNVEKPKSPPNFNPLEDLILNKDKNDFKPEASLSRVKRQYWRYPYPYPYPIPIFIGGGFGGYGGRGFGGGFGGRGFGGRGGGFGGRGGGFGGGRGGGGGGHGGGGGRG